MMRQGTGSRGQGAGSEKVINVQGRKVSKNRLPLAVRCLLSVACCLLPVLLHAHQNSMGYAHFKVSSKSVFLHLKILPHDADSILRIDKNQDKAISQNEISPMEPLIFFYIQSKLKILYGGKPCAFSPGKLTYEESQKYMQIEARYQCAGEKKFLVQSGLFLEEDPGFRLVGKMDVKGREEEWIFQKGKTDWEVLTSAPRSLPAQLAHFVRLGTEHIFLGYDHILFLFGLLLLGGRFRNLLKIVTSFTVAHSITLILAALEFLKLPSKFVESAIAFSIMYIAVENLFVKSSDKRWRITFFFGLVHGFGFSSVLRDLGLPERGLVLSLLSFNAGVEIGQACIVSALFPVVLFVHRFRWNTHAVRFASLVILFFGAEWFLDRAVGWAPLRIIVSLLVSS